MGVKLAKIYTGVEVAQVNFECYHELSDIKVEAKQ